MPVSSNCIVCQSPLVAKVNVAILRGISINAIAEKTKLPVFSLRKHQHKHLPFRRQDAPEPVTIKERLELCRFQLKRLAILAESGETVTQAIATVRAEMSLIELEGRLEGKIQGPHKAMLAAAPTGEVEISFAGGRAISKEAASD